MKKLILFCCLFLFVRCSYAQMSYDTVLSMNIGVGLTYTKYYAPAGPWTLYVLEAELKNGYNKIESVKGNDNMVGRETTTSMAKRNSYAGHRVLGAVNADFFDMDSGTPINVQVKNGEMVTNPDGLSTIGFDANNKPMLARVAYTGSIIAKNLVNPLTAVNYTRGTDQAILYNKYFGSSTQTNQYGTELKLNPIDAWAVNDTIRCVVLEKTANVGNMAYSGSQVVLSAHGASQTFVNNNIKVGDTIKIVNSLMPGLPKIKEMVGGFPKIVYQGKNYAAQGDIDEGGPDHTYLGEPRTAAGFSKDSTKLYLVAVDGREDKSVGMTLPQLADFMVAIGVYNGINFDGGGSTTMVVRDSIVNFTSDGSERAVANSLLIVSNAPDSGVLKSIKLSPSALKIYRGNSQQFAISALDEYFNPQNVNISQVKFTIDPKVGSITSSGLFTAGTKADTGYIYASYNGLKDSCKIIVKVISKVVLAPRNCVADAVKPFQYRIQAYDFDGIQYYPTLNEYTWKVTDPTIGSIDTMGIFTGKVNGSTKVIAAYNNVADTVAITVQKGSGLVLLDSLESITSWTLSGDNIDTTYTKLSVSNQVLDQGKGSLKIDYKFTYNSNSLNWVYLNTDIPVYGIPDTIKIDGQSDGQKHVIYFLVSDENSELFNIATNKYLEQTTTFEPLKSAFSKFAALSPGTVFDYPARIKQIKIKLGSAHVSGQVYTGTIYLDNLRVSYPTGTTGVENETVLPLNFNLAQNYPNPFNPSTTIEFTTTESGFVELKIYDVLGREMDSLIKNNLSAGNHKVVWNASSFTSGVYFYELKVNSNKSVKKMLLLK
jgi:exopolysaccharide biosynthesis protein